MLAVSSMTGLLGVAGLVEAVGCAAGAEYSLAASVSSMAAADTPTETAGGELSGEWERTIGACT